MTKIEAKIVTHSKCPRGHELITYELVFPRFLLAELNTHRMFSKNSASSRAIPFKKMVEMVKNNPFIPMAFQHEHKGMQGSEYFTGIDAEVAERNWVVASEKAIMMATHMNTGGVTKQLCNRLLEPFMWHKVLLTTGLEGLRNFFELRCPEYKVPYTWDAETKVFKSKKEATKYWKDKSDTDPSIGKPQERSVLDWLQLNKGQAEIHMMELAESMYDAYNESVPQKLKEGEYHIPYDEELLDLAAGKGYTYKDIIKASTGLCARTSYITVGDEKIPSIETLIGIHDKMKDSVPFHASPYEHCSICPSQEEYDNSIRGSEKGWFRNYKGFKSYRQMLEEKL